MDHEINLLAEIATTYPQAAYTAYVTSYQHKMTYFLRTIPGIEKQLEKIDEVVRHKLIPAIIGGHIINDTERKMLSLPTRLGGMGIKIFSQTAETDFKDSSRITSNLQDQILGTNENETEKKTKYQIKNEREKRNQEQLKQFLNMCDEK